MKVAIQGELGSFSHEAAERMLPRCTVVPCARAVEVFDRIEEGSAGAAGIAGQKAASEYSGNILQAGIEDDKRNVTRFFLVRKRSRGARKKKGSADYHDLIPRGANKTSIVFQVKNAPGALFKSLSVFALR